MLAVLHHYLYLPAALGYVLVLLLGLALGGLLYAVLLVYYHWRAGPMGDFLSVVSAFFGYRRRGWILIPTMLTLPLGYVVGLLVAPAAAGRGELSTHYSILLQTVAGAIATLLVVIAVTRLASRRTRLVVREARVVAVIWMALGELGAIAAMSPGLPAGLQRPAFGLMVGGAVAGAMALVFTAASLEVEEG
jgi:hypothetical protein